MQATTKSTTNTKPFLPSIKFLLDSSVEMFNDQQRIPVEPRNPSDSYINTSSRKLPTLSLNIPSPKGHLVSPVERNFDNNNNNNMSGYHHHKGNQYQNNNLPRLPSISVTIGQIEPVLSNNNNNRGTVTTVQKNSRPNSIQSLLSPPESPDMTNNPSFNDYETHHNHVAAEQQQQQRPRLVHPPPSVYSSTPQYYPSYAYVHSEQRGYDRVGDYHQERVVYDRAYSEQQQRAYPSSNTSPTTLQPAFSPFESRSTTTHSTLHRIMNDGSVITRRMSAPTTTNDQLTSPVPGGSSNNNNRYQCPFCSKRFSRPSSLRIHTYSHTGEKPFVCTEPGCGRKFSVQSNMRRHLRVHRLGRPVKKVRYDGEVEGVKMLNHGAPRNC